MRGSTCVQSIGCGASERFMPKSGLFICTERLPMKKFRLLGVAGALALSIGARAESSFPADTWPAITAESMPAACRVKLEELQRGVQAGATTAMMVVVGGRPVFQYGPVDRVSYIASARKSVLALMYGPYVVAGAISLDQTIGEVGIDEADGLLPLERSATIRDLLTARSGVYHVAANAGDDSAAAPPRGSQAPGTYFLYNNWDFNAAGTAFERLTGQSIYEAFQRDVALPIGMQDYRLDRQSKYINRARSLHDAYHFELSTRDMARFGLLMLEDGRWRDRQVVPADWVRKITATVTLPRDMNPPKTASVGLGYGYLWWTFEDDSPSPMRGAYLAWGHLGQYILVIPQRRMVIAHKVAPRLLFQQQVPLTRFIQLVRPLVEVDCKSDEDDARRVGEGDPLRLTRAR